MVLYGHKLLVVKQCSSLWFAMEDASSNMEDVDVFINTLWKDKVARKKPSLTRTISKIATLNSFSEEDQVVGVLTSGGDSSGCNHITGVL